MKSNHSKNPNTIDEKHTEMLNQFQSNESVVIPQLYAEIEELKKKIKILKPNQIEEYMESRDKILQKRGAIKKIKSQKKQYLLENSNYIFNYFEQKKDISSGGGKQNVNVLNSFFKINPKQTDESNPSMEHSQSKKAYQNYWKNVNNEIINIQDFIVPSDVCEVCRKGELIPQD